MPRASPHEGYRGDVGGEGEVLHVQKGNGDEIRGMESAGALVWCNRVPDGHVVSLISLKHSA